MYSKAVKVSSETRIHFRQTSISLSEAANKRITGDKTNRDSTGDLRCFICDGKITGTCFPLVVGVTPYSKTDIPTKIGQLMGEGFMVVVSEDDNLCKRCTSLLYQLDRLEVDLNLVKDALTNYLKLKYQLNEEDHEIATSRDDSSFLLYNEEENENDKASCKKLCGREGEVAVDEEFKDGCENIPGILSSATKSPKKINAEIILDERLGKRRKKKRRTTDALGVLNGQSSSTNKEYKCKSSRGTQKQIKNIHSAEWLCHICDMIFEEENMLASHIKTSSHNDMVHHKLQSGQPGNKKTSIFISGEYTCSICNFKTGSIATYRDHQQFHFQNPSEYESSCKSFLKRAHGQKLNSYKTDDHFVDSTEKGSEQKVIQEELTCNLQNGITKDGFNILKAEDKVTVDTNYTMTESQKLATEDRIPNTEHYFCSSCSLVFLSDRLLQHHKNVHHTLPSLRKDTLLTTEITSHNFCDLQQKGCLDSNKSSNQYMNNENFMNLFKKVSTQFMQVPNRSNNNLNGTELAIENVSGRVTSNSTTCAKNDCDSSQHADGEIDYTVSGKNEQQSATTQNSTFENSSESLVTTHRSHSSEATQVNNSIPCNFPINKFMENARTDSAVKQKGNSEKNVSSNSSHEYLLGAPYRDIQKSELVSKNGTESTKQKDCEMKAKVDNETSLSDSCGSISYPPQTMKELRTPFLFHITKPGTAQCEICGKFFSSNSKMLYHRDICSKNLSCKLCNKHFLNMNDLHKHNSEKHQTHKMHHNCMHCSASFLTKELCLTHEENCVFVPYCDECGEKFSEVDQLRSHKDTTHRDPHCRYCGKEILKLKTLRYHELRHMKETAEKFECSECEKVFKTKTGLRHHFALHTGQYKFCCDYCGRGFMSRMMMEEHRSKHTKEERYICDVCGRKFCFQSTYWIHRKWHDNPFPYKCNFCGRKFRHSSLLAVHKRKHTGERPYKCPHCPLTFPVGGTLKRHIILHTGVYPYNCEVCKRGFTTRHKFAIHLSKIHGDSKMLNEKSRPNEFKMVIRDNETVKKQDNVEPSAEWQNPDDSEQVDMNFRLGSSAGGVDNFDHLEGAMSCSLVPDELLVGNAFATRVVEIVLDDTSQAVAAVTVADPEANNLPDLWYQNNVQSNQIAVQNSQVALKTELQPELQMSKCELQNTKTTLQNKMLASQTVLNSAIQQMSMAKQSVAAAFLDAVHMLIEDATARGNNTDTQNSCTRHNYATKDACNHLQQSNSSTNQQQDSSNNIFPDSDIARAMTLKRHKACAIVSNVIGTSHKEVLAKKLQHAKFSIMTDESTDIGTVKNSCLAIRFYDKHSGCIESKFWELYKVYEDGDLNVEKASTAEYLYNGVVKTFQQHNIPFANIIGFGADGCNTMMGVQWILPKFTTFNEYFQSRAVAIVDLHDKIKALYTEILLYFMKRTYVMGKNLSDVDPKNAAHHLEDSQLYLGVKILKNVGTPEIKNHPHLIKDFYHRCRNFLVLGLGCHLRSKGKHPDCVSAQLAMVEENGNFVGKPSTEVPRKSKCFVCDVIISDGGVWLMELLSVNANLLENIGSLMGDGAFVIVSWNDIVCNACSLLLKYFTKLERDLMILKKVLRYYLKVKYRLEDDGFDTNTTISRQDIDYIAECSSQVLSASDTEGSQLSYRPQKLDLPLSQKSHCDKTELVPRNKTAKVSNSDTVSGLNRKETNIFKKEKLKTRNVAAQERCHFENYHSTSEHCKNNEAHEKQLERTIDADVCVSTTDNMGCALNVEDHHSKRQKCFMSHSLRNGNNDTKLPDQHDEAHSLLFKEGALKHKCPPGKNDNTISVENSDGKMKNVISITLSSDSEQEFAEDQCIQSSTREHMPQLPFMKSPVYRMLRKNSNSVTTQENKQVSEEKNKTDTFEENKKVINQSIFSEDIIVHDNTKPEKSGLKPLAKETGKIILNKGYVVASNSIANICTKTLENLIQKELPKCTESSVRSPPHSVVINGEQSTRTEGLDSSDQMLYLPQKTFKRPEKGTCGSPGSENVLKSIEDNQMMLHNPQNEWAGGLEIGLDDDMPHIVLGDEMVVDGSTCEEIAFEEIQDTSTHNNEKNYSIQREIAESNISKIENLNALCSGDAEIDFIESTTTEETAIRTGHEENANKASQLVSDTSSSGNQSAASENSSINNERTILRSCDVKTRASLLFQENVSHLPACEKLFECHICNRILTTQSNLKRHLLKHEKCTVGSIICELCNEQLVDRVHLKQHLKVQHQQYVKCAFCDKEFSNMKLCRDHELTHPERATYKCDICNQMFVTEGRLKNHKELIHDDLCDTFRDNDFFKCHICFKTLRTHHNLKRHLTNHEKPPVSVSCNFCQEVFTEKSKLYQHREEKHPKKHNCTFCNKEFLSLRSCRIHESLHPERVVYKCNICETVFLTELRLNRHKDIYHREPYCRICRKEITDRSKLIEHERRHGRFKQVFMCKECPKVFRTASGLKYHMSVHTGKYAVYCEICGKGLHSEVVLAEHKATHTKEVRYTCELCGRTFSSNSTYRMHRLWHDNPLPYQCNFCDKKFKHTSILAVHKRRVHTGERPYKCKYCNMAFSVSSTLNKHLILHTKQYPFKCEQCNKGFTTRTKIANHLAKVHNDDSMLIAGKKVCEYKMALRPSEMADVESLHEFPTDETDEMDL
ncbi:uncharacterized protein LOC126204249 [Schistocerca nitens]|uniref:uncharacterized protein LOC126204249 n=1 Tax=Schistocerca nitens TaxID=7011 RepID=UPI0021195CA3|nr:uncharacterized protein LOC126204249 [Schistocerca nitens]